MHFLARLVGFRAQNGAFAASLGLWFGVQDLVKLKPSEKKEATLPLHGLR